MELPGAGSDTQMEDLLCGVPQLVEPELLEAVNAVGKCLVGTHWKKLFLNECVAISEARSCELGHVSYLQLTFNLVFPVELLLRVLNYPPSRLIWDNSLTGLRVISGDPLLDSVLEILHKNEEATILQRYVRNSEGTIVSIGLVHEPQEKGNEWITKCSSFEFAFIWQTTGHCGVEIVQSESRHSNSGSFTRKKLKWAEKYYAEVLCQIPK